MDKNLYLLAELDNELQIELKDLDKAILESGLVGKQTKDIPYHITLCSFSLDYEKYLFNLLDDVSKQFSKIDMTFSSLGLFGLKILFVSPDMNIELVNLYNYLKEKSLQKDDDLAAHVTLLIDDPENILKILPKISAKFSRLTGKITSISMYEFFPKRFIKRIEL